MEDNKRNESNDFEQQSIPEDSASRQPAADTSADSPADLQSAVPGADAVDASAADLPNTPEAEAPYAEADLAGPSAHAPARDKSPLLVAGISALLFIVILLLLVFTRPSAEIGLEPLSVDENGAVLVDSPFLLTMEGTHTEERLRELISVEPDLPYDIAETEDGGYLITFLHLLETGGTLEITVDGAAFSFQVENRLVVTSAFPADNATNVPVHSGIEFTFNTRELTADDLARHFTISPAVEGNFLFEDGRYVFYPTTDMEYDTHYSVRLEAGLAAASGASLGKAYTFGFRTISMERESTEWVFQFSKNPVSYNVLTDDAPLLQAYMDSARVAVEDLPIDVTVHAFPGWESYLEAMERAAGGSSRYRSSLLSVDTRSLAEQAAFTLRPIPAEQSEDTPSYYYLLEFPEALPQGWYIATFTFQLTDGQTLTRQLFLQSSDLSLFHMQSGGDMLVWLNDAATGEPVAGADFSITGAYHASGTTGDDGTALITTGQYTIEQYDSATAAFFTVTAGEQVFVDISHQYNNGDYAGIAYDYFYYLFTDRPIYHTTDTIQAWGMLRPRIEDARPVGELRLALSHGAAEQAIQLQPDGTFTATLSFENMAAQDWGSIQLMAGDDTITSTYLQILDFVKPVYTATTQADRPVYLTRDGTDAAISLDVTTFDGTPVSAFPVRVSSWSGLSVGEEQLRTDEQGHLQVQAGIALDKDTWYPQSYQYMFRSDDAESENFYRYGSAHVIHRDVMLTAKPDTAGARPSLLVNTNAIDVSSITSSAQLWDRENLRGTPLSRQATARVHKVYYTREVIGTYYDFINRVTRESYHYRHHDDVVDTQTFTTGADGSYVLEGLPAPEPGAYYYVEVSTPDLTGRTVTVRAYLGSIYERNYQRNAGSPRYVLNKVVDLSGAETQDDGEGGALYPAAATLSSRFQDNESVTFRLENNDDAVESFTGRLLYSVVQDHFTHRGLSAAATFTLPYSADLLPNYVITGAYFDGRYIYLLENKAMSYSPDQRKLEIALEADQTAYRPGQEITVSAAVTNVYTGRAAADTTVVLSVVDEAIFALAEQNSNILSSIYSAVFYPSINKYVSYTPSDLSIAGEKGGGGGEGETRTDFEDTAFFSTAVTDSQGRASFTFRLPDNITSWRLTSLAFSPDNHAGNQVENVSATKEFFLLPVLSDTILDGDTFSVGLRGSGVGVGAADPVAYTVTVEGDGVSQTLRADSTLRAYTSVQLDGLAAGDYTVTVRGECGGYADAIRLPFSVVPSGVEVSLVETVDLRQGISVAPLRYPVCIHFYDQSYQTYNRVFRAVYQNSHGVRADMRLARRYAVSQLEMWGDAWYNPDALQEDISDLNGRSELLRLLPYAKPNIELTVKAHLALPNLVSLDALEGIAISGNGYEGARSAAYLAQVLVGELPAADLSRLLEAGEGADYVDRVYLALALALSGDESAARAWYGRNVTPNLRSSTALSGEVLRKVEAGDPDRSDNDCTAAASMLATVLGTEDAEGLVLYLAEKQSRYDPYLLEQVLYLTRCQPDGGDGASFSYVRDGEAVTQSLDRNTRHITFTKDQLAEADFRVLSGQVFADIYYTGTPDEANQGGRKLIGMTKTIEAVDGGEITTGSAVKITLIPDFSALDTGAGDQTVIVDDYIPSGMRFERYDRKDFRAGSRSWYLSSRQGQRVQFVVHRVTRSSTLTPIVYYARCASPGEYVVESAYANSASADVWGASERWTVRIR